MDNIFSAQQRLVPDLFVKMHRRLSILSIIQAHEPIGRRSLSELSTFTERVLRTEINVLKEERLILVSKSGMTITEDGLACLRLMKSFMAQYSAMVSLSENIRQKYHLNEVIVIEGNADVSIEAFQQLGIEASKYLVSLIEPKTSVAVTGGSTMAEVAKNLPQLNFDVSFIPARGGLGETTSQQANVIVSLMADKTGGTFQTLYVPDQISDSSYNSLMSEPTIMQTLCNIKDADIVIHSVGNAMKMAERRSTKEDVKHQLKKDGALGEAFGYYLDKTGNVVLRVRTIGIQLEDLKSKARIITVAGGTSKVEALKAYLNIAPPQTTLVIDEAVATGLLN